MFSISFWVLKQKLCWFTNFGMLHLSCCPCSLSQDLILLRMCFLSSLGKVWLCCSATHSWFWKGTINSCSYTLQYNNTTIFAHLYTISPVFSSNPFWQPCLNASLFRQPVWWSDGWAWQSFVPLVPSFVFTPFKTLCIMPCIEEVTFFLLDHPEKHRAKLASGWTSMIFSTGSWKRNASSK